MQVLPDISWLGLQTMLPAGLQVIQSMLRLEVLPPNNWRRAGCRLACRCALQEASVMIAGPASHMTPQSSSRREVVLAECHITCGTQACARQLQAGPVQCAAVGAPDPAASAQQVPCQSPPAAKTHLSASLHGILHHVVIGLYIRLGLLLGLPEGQAPNELIKCSDGRSRLGGLLSLLLIWKASGGSH